jgi:hypothetical protein
MGKNPRLRKREFNVDMKMVNKIACSVAAVSVLSMIGFGYFSSQSYTSKSSEFDTEIASLNGRLNELQNATSGTSVKEIQQNMNSATNLGNKVTELQNTWNKPLGSEDYKAVEASGGQSVDALNTTRISNLKLLFASGDTQGATNWYPKIEGTKSSKASWKFITTTSFSSVKQNVMWQCVGENGELYAYVTAVYNADKDLFEDVSVNITSFGLQAQNA